MKEVQLREINSDFVYCPFCGKSNLFKQQKLEGTIDYSCIRCKKPIDDYWNEHLIEKRSSRICHNCSQPTFSGLEFCINCGSNQIEDLLKGETLTKRESFVNYGGISLILGIFILITSPLIARWINETFGLVGRIAGPLDGILIIVSLYFGVISIKHRRGQIGIALTLIGLLLGIVKITGII
jgi:DNA-directed RNA polymerase subunit RPC12/RpoP